MKRRIVAGVLCTGIAAAWFARRSEQPLTHLASGRTAAITWRRAARPQPPPPKIALPPRVLPPDVPGEMLPSGVHVLPTMPKQPPPRDTEPPSLRR